MLSEPSHKLRILADTTLHPIKRSLNETFFKSKFLNQTFNF